MNGKHISWIVLAAVAPALAACSGGNKPNTDFDDAPWEVRVESPTDTLSYVQGEGDEDAVYEPDPPEGPENGGPIVDTPVVAETKTGTSNTTAAGTTPPKADVFTPGWRVQIFASSSMVNADALAEEARSKFTEPVYVVYEPPLYKVRVGDFLSKNEARHMQNRAKAENFDAWIVEALVVRPDR